MTDLGELELWAEAIHDDPEIPDRTKVRQLMKCFREAKRTASELKEELDKDLKERTCES